MNKSELFKAAHKLTKEVIKTGDDYRVTFGAAIKFILESNKMESEVKYWGKKGHRFYVDMPRDFMGKVTLESVGYVEYANKALDFSNINPANIEAVKAAFEAKMNELAERYGDKYKKAGGLLGLNFTF